MMTYDFLLSVGGPAYGHAFAAYVKTDAPDYRGYGTCACIGVGDSPEEAAEDARQLIALTASNGGYGYRIIYEGSN